MKRNFNYPTTSSLYLITNQSNITLNGTYQMAAATNNFQNRALYAINKTSDNNKIITLYINADPFMSVDKDNKIISIDGNIKEKAVSLVREMIFRINQYNSFFSWNISNGLLSFELFLPEQNNKYQFDMKWTGIPSADLDLFRQTIEKYLELYNFN